VSPPSIQTLAAGLAEVVANPERAEAMGRAARATFEERFCLEQTRDGLVAEIFG